MTGRVEQGVGAHHKAERPSSLFVRLAYIPARSMASPLCCRRLFDRERAIPGDMDVDSVTFLETKGFDDDGGKANGQTVAPP